MAHMYSLTEMTGRRKNVDRTIVIATVEVKRFTFIVTLGSIVASLPVAAVVALLLGPYAAFAFILPVVFVFAGLFLVDQRSRKGLQLRRYEAMWDSRQAKSSRGTVYVCSQPLQRAEVRTLIQSVIPNVTYSENDAMTPAQAAPAAVGKADQSHPRARPKRSFLE